MPNSLLLLLKFFYFLVALDLSADGKRNDLLVGQVATVTNGGRAIGVLSQAVVGVVVDQVTTLSVSPGIAVAARVAGQELALGIDDALVGAEERVNVVIIAEDPGLSIRAVAGGPGDGTRSVIGQALEGEGVEDGTGGGDNGVVGTSHGTRDAEDSGSVGGNIGGGDATSADLDLGGLASPEVLDGELGVGVDASGADTKLGPRDLGRGSGSTLVEDGQETVAVGQALGEDIPGGVLGSKGGLLDQSVLVDSNEVLVGKDGELLSSEGGNVGRDDERARERRPQGHLTSLLGESKVLVVGDEEVGVVEEVLVLETSQTNVLTVVGHDTLPGVALGVVVDDIVGVTGQLTKVRRPAHDSVPVSEVLGAREVGWGGVGEDHGLVERLEKVMPLLVDGVVSLLAVARDVAAVELEVVESPSREVLEVNLLVVEGTGVTAARQSTGVRVDTGDESLGSHVLGEPRKTLGELDGVPDHRAVVCTLVGGPGIVKVQSVVASGEQAVLGHGIGRIDEDGLVDVGGVTSPVVESHRGERKILKGVGGNSQASRGQNNLSLHDDF